MGRLPPTKLKRPRAKREPRARFVVFCEGRNTEPTYLNALKRIYSNALISIEINKGVGVPYTQAQLAIERARQLGILKGGGKRKDYFSRRDQIWVVVDRDEHPRFDEAIKLCAAKGIFVARSNPCFEIWLILHQQEYHKPDGRWAVQSFLKSLFPEYDPSRSKAMDCDRLMDSVAEAERRAQVQLACRSEEGDPFGRPSTTMFELTTAIRQASDEAG